MNIQSKTLFVKVTEPIQIGELKLTIEAQVWVVIKDNGVMVIDDIEETDYTDITYMNIPIDGYDNWKKFREFHKGMGIDFEKLICSKFDEIFTIESVGNLISNNIVLK